MNVLCGYLTTGKRLRFYEEELDGIALLRGELPQRGDPKKHLRKALSFFRRMGVTLLLNGPEDAERWGIPLVETGSLYRRHAAEAALMFMKRREIAPRQAVVGIRGSRWTREMDATCEQLAGQVRSLSLALPEWESEEASWVLQRRYGISVLNGDGDVTLCFTPCEAQAGRLLLGEKRPDIADVNFGRSFSHLPKDAAEGLAAVLCL